MPKETYVKPEVKTEILEPEQALLCTQGTGENYGRCPKCFHFHPVCYCWCGCHHWYNH